MQDACHIYSTPRLALFVHGITQAMRTCEVWPAVLVREDNTLLVMYSLDKCIGYSTNFQVFERLH